MSSKSGSQDDNVYGATAAKQKTGRQEDGSWLKSDGTVLPPKDPRRVPYEEPAEKQVDGNEEVVETPDGSVSFLAVRMSQDRYARVAQFLERKRLKCMYEVTESYTKVKPRPFYSYDELEQLRRGEMKR